VIHTDLIRYDWNKHSVKRTSLLISISEKPGKYKLTDYNNTVYGKFPSLFAFKVSITSSTEEDMKSWSM
jgi:hypothetical protein